MKNIKISKTYAKVFFNKAQEQTSLKNVLEDFALLRDVLNANKKLARFFASRLSSSEHKRKVIDLCKFHPTSQEFLYLLINNNQIDSLSYIYEAMVNLNIEDAGEVPAILVTANDMSEKDIKECIKSLEKKLGKKFSIDHKVDESLIGGVVLKFGSMMYDASVRSAMQKLKTIRA